jgi:hypothetical protein
MALNRPKAARTVAEDKRQRLAQHLAGAQSDQSHSVPVSIQSVVSI